MSDNAQLYRFFKDEISFINKFDTLDTYEETNNGDWNLEFIENWLISCCCLLVMEFSWFMFHETFVSLFIDGVYMQYSMYYIRLTPEKVHTAIFYFFGRKIVEIMILFNFSHFCSWCCFLLLWYFANWMSNNSVEIAFDQLLNQRFNPPRFATLFHWNIVVVGSSALPRIINLFELNKLFLVWARQAATFGAKPVF